MGTWSIRWESTCYFIVWRDRYMCCLWVDSPPGCLHSINNYSSVVAGGVPSLPTYVGGMCELSIPTWCAVCLFDAEIQYKFLGMKVEVFDQDGKNIEHTGEAGEMVCTRPHPSLPVKFWVTVILRMERNFVRHISIIIQVYVPGPDGFTECTYHYRRLETELFHGRQSQNEGNYDSWPKVTHLGLSMSLLF